MSEAVFQIYDWYTVDEEIDEDEDSTDDDEEDVYEKQNYMIHLFGVNKDGKNVHCKVKDFTPYYFIELPENWHKNWTDPFMESLKQSLPKAIRGEFVCDDRQVKRAVKLKYKFRNYQWNSPKKFMQLVFKSESAARMMYYKLKKPYNFPMARLFKHRFPIYEKNVLPILRFIHLRKIQPSSWVRIEDYKEIDMKYAESDFEINYEVNWRKVHAGEEKKTASIKIASFDIECDSSHGDFPIAKKDYQKLASNIYEEYLRLIRNNKKANPTLVKQWIKCAFRDITHEKYDDSMKSSIQTIFLKRPSQYSDVSSDEIEKMSVKILGILLKKTKGKETIELISNELDSILPGVKGDKVIQIGTVIQDYANPSNVKRHIVTLDGCSDLTGIEVETCKTVEELIYKWVRMMKREQPNIVTGYNIFGFDIKFLWECAEEFGCLKYLRKLGALKNKECSMETKELFSAALGHNFLFYFDSPGIVYVDLMKVIQKDHNLSSYKLDDVSTQFINSGITQFEHSENSVKVYTKSTFSLKVGDYVAVFKQTIIGNEFVGDKRRILEMTENDSFILEGEAKEEFPENPKSFYWSVGKDNVSPQDIFDMQRGSDEDRGIVAKYCVQDCELCLNIMQKLEIITNNLGMSNVCLVPFSYLFMRGQMIKTLSLVSSECQKENYLIPELPRPKEDTKDSYEGAEVLEPTPAIFLNDPVSVLDYSSLYPSSMIGSNISHDSIIKESKYQGESGAKLLEEMGIKFEDVSYDNYINKLVGKTWKKSIVKENPVVTCRFIQPTLNEDGSIDNSSRGILPRILMKLLKARKDTRNQIKTEKDAFRRSVLDGLQLAYKVTANSLYGGVGAEVSSLYYKDIAASTTAIGRQHLHLAKDYVKEHFPTAEIVYGDSVTGYTPITIKYKGRVIIEKIEDVAKRFGEDKWLNCIEPGKQDKEACELDDCYTWTSKGWTKLYRVIRHILVKEKKIIRVLTHTGCVDVTDDHSLILKSGVKISPNDLKVGDELLQRDIEFDENNDMDITVQEARIFGMFFGDGSCGKYDCPSGLKRSWALNNANISMLNDYKLLCEEVYGQEFNILDTLKSSGVYKLVPKGDIKSLVMKYRPLLYNGLNKVIPDIIMNSTEEVKDAFFKGVYDADGDKEGNNKRIDQKSMISAMSLYNLGKRMGYNVSINTRKDKPHIFRLTYSKTKLRKKSYTIKKIGNIDYEGYVYDLTTDNHEFQAGVGNIIVHNTDSIFVNFKPENSGKEGIQESIDRSVEVEEGIQKFLAYPHKLEYEKTFWPFILLRKKGYIGNKYEFDLERYYQTSMGVVTKRRDNAGIVKYVYDGIIKRIINNRDIEGAVRFLLTTVDDILEGKFPLQYFIITKRLNAVYANPAAIVHKALADRMGDRDPGNKPQSNDRIPFVYIQTKVAPKLQGDRVEHPEFIVKNKLKIDYLFYITNQVSKPVCQVMGLALENLRNYGYRLPKDHFDLLQRKLEREGKKSTSEIREKLMEEKAKEAYNVLFKSRVLIEEGKKFGQRSITSFFK